VCLFVVLYFCVLLQDMAVRVMDSNALERERGITILAKNTAIRWGAQAAGSLCRGHHNSLACSSAGVCVYAHCCQDGAVRTLTCSNCRPVCVNDLAVCASEVPYPGGCWAPEVTESEFKRQDGTQQHSSHPKPPCPPPPSLQLRAHAPFSRSSGTRASKST
jgi:hypothetical protein